MAEYPPGDPDRRRRAARRRPRFRERRLASRRGKALRRLRCAHAGDHVLNALQSARLDRKPGGTAGADRLQPSHRHLDHQRRALQPTVLQGGGGAVSAATRGAGRPRHQRQRLLQGLGDDRLAHRLADASAFRREAAWRDDAIREQRHCGLCAGGGASGDRGGRALREGSARALPSWSRRRLCGALRSQQDRAADQARGRDVRHAGSRRGGGFDRSPAHASSKRRMSGSRPAGSSDRRRRASCACASAAKRRTLRKPAAGSPRR